MPKADKGRDGVKTRAYMFLRTSFKDDPFEHVRFQQPDNQRRFPPLQ